MKVIFRADGNLSMGLGHIMRSAALMQMLHPHFSCIFYTRNPEYFPFSEFLVKPEIKQVFTDDILEDALQLTKEVSNSIVVLDGYHFTTTYQQIIKSTGQKLVCIDDIISCHFISDAVINHAGGISPTDYSKEAYTKLLLGPSYALIKPLFWELPRPDRKFNNYKMLIALGGADLNNDTEKILRKLTYMRYFVEIHVVLGAANPYFKKISADFNDDRIKFHSNIPAKFMRQLMHECTYAILPPSTISYEYMSVGGVVFLYKIADNQKHIYKYFLENKLAFPFEMIGNTNSEDFAVALQQQRKYFDGSSQQRLINFFSSLAQK